MPRERRPGTPTICRTAGVMLDLIRRHGPQRIERIALVAEVSRMTVNRATVWLRDHDVPLYFDRSDMRWHVGELEPLANWTLADAVEAGALTKAEAEAIATLTAAGTPRKVH